MLAGFTILGLTGGLLLLVALVGVVILLFEILMFISAVKNDHITDTVKLVWLAGMLLIHPFVAIAYYFTDHQRAR